jgi:GAF domain-containing protein
MRFLRTLFAVTHTYPNPIDRQRASGMVFVGWALILLAAVLLGIGGLPRLVSGAALPLMVIVYWLVFPLLALVTGLSVMVLVQAGELHLASRLFVLFHIASVAPLFTQGLYLPVTVLLLLPVLAAGVLLSRRGTLITLGAVVLIVIAASLVQAQLDVVINVFPLQELSRDLLLIGGALLLSTLYIWLFSGNFNLAIRESLGSANQVEWLNEFIQQLAEAGDEDTVLHAALDLLRTRFDYSFAQVYLLDESQTLVPRASTLISGQVEGEPVSLVDANGISVAARTRQPVPMTGTDFAGRRSHFLAATHSAIAVPLLVQNQLIGVLDIQNDEPTVFYRSTMTILSLLGAQIADKLQNLRAAAVLRRNLDEQKEITENLRVQLLKRESGSLQGISAVWDRYLAGRGEQTYGFDVIPNARVPQPATDLPPTLMPALLKGEMDVIEAGDEQVISVPIKIGDQVLGAMSFAVPKDRPITQSQRDMAQSVADRLALALDNTRLLEQTQAQALRERKANEAGSQLISTNDVNTVLETAAELFNNALGAIRTRIYIQPEAAPEPPSQNGAHTS